MRNGNSSGGATLLRQNISVNQKKAGTSLRASKQPKAATGRLIHPIPPPPAIPPEFQAPRLVTLLIDRPNRADSTAGVSWCQQFLLPNEHGDDYMMIYLPRNASFSIAADGVVIYNEDHESPPGGGRGILTIQARMTQDQLARIGLGTHVTMPDEQILWIPIQPNGQPRVTHDGALKLPQQKGGSVQ